MYADYSKGNLWVWRTTVRDLKFCRYFGICPLGRVDCILFVLDRFGVGGPRCSFSRWFRISHLKNSQKWSRGGGSPFKIRILGLKLPFFGPPEKGLQIYFTVSVMVLIHRCICIFDWKSTKTPPNLFPGGHMPLQKSIFRVQMTLFSVYQYSPSKTP